MVNFWGLLDIFIHGEINREIFLGEIVPYAFVIVVDSIRYIIDTFTIFDKFD